MLHNRSVPVDTVLPHLVYQDVAAALAWLTRIFHFEEHYRYGPPDAPEGAQMRCGNAYIMLTRVRQGRSTPAQSGGAYTQSLTIFVEEVDALFEQVRSAGAQIVEELNETPYGERQFAALDLAGHHWLFSRHIRDVEPSAWGAQLAQHR